MLFNSQRQLRFALLSIALLSAAPSSWAILNNPADSSIFPFAYEGDAATLGTWGTANYFGSATGYILTGDSPSAGILDVSIDAGAPNPGLVLYLQSPDWYSNATNSDGWTWEVRFRLKTGRFSLRIGDESDPHDIFDILADGKVNSRIKGTLATLPSTTDALHTYRVAQAPNSTEYNVWVDESLIGSYAAASTGIGTGGAHWFSDGSGSVSGSYELDFLRFTPGGFSPPGYNPPDPNRFIWNVNGLARWDDSGSWNQPG